MKPLKSLLLAASVLPLAVSAAHADQFVRMVSGPSGGSWYPLGAKIMQVLEEEIGDRSRDGPGRSAVVCPFRGARPYSRGKADTCHV